MNTTDTIEVKEKKKSGAAICFFVALAVSVVATILRLISLFKFYNDSLGYYQMNEIFPVISNIFYGVAAAFCLVAAYFIVRPKENVPAPSRMATLGALVPGAAFGAHAVSLIPKLIENIKLMQSGEKKIDILLIIVLLSAVLATAFFFMIALCKKHGALTVLAGVGVTAWGAFSWIRSYLEFYTPMNSPNKLFFHFGCISVMLIAAAELRSLFGISKPKFYYFTLFTSLLTFSVSAIPSIIGDMAGVFKIYVLDYENVVMLALFVYAIIRGVTLIFAKIPEKQLEEKVSAKADAMTNTPNANEGLEDTAQENTEENISSEE